ncbi:hypothetical protein VMCG_05644 [Cytospora schulzeri]|uniref:WW domain-containing protein n=1 Tax=Cytospora schulzeri TaxID=448051 RepID=A0A423WEL3_9PEZI|nr:hypothetical protein VMCG_05644 [Valsa malicola]
MASLPPGWAADYDGSRWFFLYKPTGHFQYQFPKPGDEFPDFGGGLALDLGLSLGLGLDGGELSPEERLESERQVRRQTTVPVARKEGGMDGESQQEGVDAGIGSTGRGSDVKVNEEGDEGGDVFCFESFGYFGPADSGHVSLKYRKEDMERDKERGAHRRRAASGGIDPQHISPPTSVSNTTPRASISEPSAIDSFSVTEETTTAEAKHADSFPTSEPNKTQQATVTQPEAKASETTGRRPPAQPDGRRWEGQHQIAAHEPPMLDGRAIDSVPRPLTFSPSRFMPELYSELTPPCAEEVNPPPVELPDNGASWLEPVPVPNLLNQYPVELPTDGRFFHRGEGRDGTGGEPEQQGVVQGNGDTTKLGRRLDSEQYSEAVRYPRANTMPPKLPPKEPLDEVLHREIMDYFPGYSSKPASQSQPTTVQKQASTPTDTSTGGRRSDMPSYTGDLTHVPSVLRPGPRRSSQQPLPQQSGKPTLQHAVTEPVHRAPVWPSQPRHNNNTMLAELPSQASFQSVPIGPPADKPRPVAEKSRAAAPAAVNFVIPIDHRPSLSDLHGSAATSAAAAAAVSSAQQTPPPPPPAAAPEYSLGANFASRPSATWPRVAPALNGGATVSGATSSPPMRRVPSDNAPYRAEDKVLRMTEQMGNGREEKVPPLPPHLLPGGPTKAAPEWSWGYAR